MNYNQQYVGLNPICSWSEVKDSSQRADKPEGATARGLFTTSGVFVPKINKKVCKR